jgi:endonuclease/exonuclease/phosphatase family metal-dependent hydrolase
LPFTLRKEAFGARLRVSVASYNIYKCLGTDGRFDPDRILSVLLELDADIIALQEADMRFDDRRGLLDLAALRLRGGYSAVTDVGLRETSHGFHGNVVLYREGREIDQTSRSRASRYYRR